MTNGYTCFNCGQFVPAGVWHQCNGADGNQYIPIQQPIYQTSPFILIDKSVIEKLDEIIGLLKEMNKDNGESRKE